jgi:hypothetical protein
MAVVISVLAAVGVASSVASIGVCSSSSKEGCVIELSSAVVVASDS